MSIERKSMEPQGGKGNGGGGGLGSGDGDGGGGVCGGPLQLSSEVSAVAVTFGVHKVGWHSVGRDAASSMA